MGVAQGDTLGRRACIVHVDDVKQKAILCDSKMIVQTSNLAQIYIIIGVDAYTLHIQLDLYSVV